VLQPEDSHLHTHRRENLKSYWIYFLPRMKNWGEGDPAE
jgi:hypothetical protein